MSTGHDEDPGCDCHSCKRSRAQDATDANLANQAHFDSCQKCHSDEDGYCDEGMRLAREAVGVRPRSCQESMDWHVLECPICFYAGQPTCEKGVRLDKMAKEELIQFPEPTDDPFGEH